MLEDQVLHCGQATKISLLGTKAAPALSIGVWLPLKEEFGSCQTPPWAIRWPLKEALQGDSQRGSVSNSYRLQASCWVVVTVAWTQGEHGLEVPLRVVSYEDAAGTDLIPSPFFTGMFTCDLLGGSAQVAVEKDRVIERRKRILLPSSFSLSR